MRAETEAEDRGEDGDGGVSPFTTTVRRRLFCRSKLAFCAIVLYTTSCSSKWSRTSITSPSELAFRLLYLAFKSFISFLCLALRLSISPRQDLCSASFLPISSSSI